MGAVAMTMCTMCSPSLAPSSATAAGHPPYPGCCPPCALPLCPKGGNGAPLAPACPSDCPQQGTWACLSTPSPLPVLWARHGGDTGSQCVRVASLPGPFLCPGGPAPGQMGQGSPLANRVGYHIQCHRMGPVWCPRRLIIPLACSAEGSSIRGCPALPSSQLSALVSPDTVCP